MKQSTSLIVFAVCVGMAGVAHAQDLQVQGEVTVQVPGQPGVYVEQQPPPPGYGQPYQQPYQQQPYQQPYYQPQQPYYPQPRPATEQSRPIVGLWLSGVILLPVSYVATWVGALYTLQDLSCWSSTTCRDPDYFWFSLVPVLGPWFMLAQNDSRGLNSAEITGAVFGGLGQVAGLIMIILGFSIRETVQVSARALDGSDRPLELSFGIDPIEGGAQLGLSLTNF